MPQSRRSFFQSLAGAIGLAAVASPGLSASTSDVPNPYIPDAYRHKLAEIWGIQAIQTDYPIPPSFRRDMVFGPDWLHKSAEDARARGEDLAWIIAEPKTPQAFRDRKLRRQLHAYRLRVFHSDTPPLSAEAYFRSRTLTDHLKDFQEALKA